MHVYSVTFVVFISFIAIKLRPRLFTFYGQLSEIKFM